jgi:hypothetical protein
VGDERTDVSDADVRALAIVQLALAAGLVSFWGVVLFLSQAPANAERVADEGALQMIVTMSVAHAVMAPSMWTAGTFLFERTLARGANIGALRAATILRLALFEGAALFGTVICHLAIMLGVAREHPLVFLNAASTFVMLGLVITTFPTRERCERLLRERRSAAS